MAEVDPTFRDYFDFEEAYIAAFDIEFGKVTLWIRHLIIMTDHPRYPNIGEADLCKLVFEGVQRFERQISEYENGDRTQGFERKSTLVHEEMIKSSGVSWLYHLAGVLENPPAWMSWDIEATSYNIEVVENIALELPLQGQS